MGIFYIVQNTQIKITGKENCILSRYNTVLYNWTEVTNRLLHDKQLLAHFLRFSAGMYKQSFSDAALIYQQNPYATKVATLEVWNKLGRRVRIASVSTYSM